MNPFPDYSAAYFTDPVRIAGGRYLAPTAPGMSAEIVPASLAAYRFPDGPQWAAAAAG